jgi:hypothetical protein
MLSTRSALIVMLLSLLLGGFTPSIAKSSSCLSLQSSESPSLTSQLGYYFLTRNNLPNSPNFYELQLNYVSSRGVFSVEHTFSPSELASISPTGEYFVVLAGQGDAFYQLPGSFSYYREQINGLTILDIETIVTRQSSFLAEINLQDIVVHLNWIANDIFELFQINDENVATIRVNLNNNTLSQRNWELSNLDLGFAEGGFFLSPNGEYIFYTSEISDESPRQDITQEWAIADENTVLTERNIALQSQSVAWLPDSTGIVFTTIDGTPTRFTLDGELTSIPYAPPRRDVFQSVVTHDSNLSVHVIRRKDYEYTEALLVVNWIEETVAVLETCEDYFSIDISAVSPDDHFLPLVVVNDETVGLHFVDLRANEMIFGASYPPTTLIMPLGWGIQPPLD